MRSLKYSLPLACIAALVASAGCTLITDVDRSKIPSSSSASNGGGDSDDDQSEGGSAGDLGAAGAPN